MDNEFYAVILTSKIHHEADQRSIDHPGHGYPAYTEEIETTPPLIGKWFKLEPVDGQRPCADFDGDCYLMTKCQVCACRNSDNPLDDLEGVCVIEI